MNSEETNPPAVVLSTTLLNVARSHQPKGSMCSSCAWARRNCEGLDFESMLVIGKDDSTGAKIVRCTGHLSSNTEKKTDFLAAALRSETFNAMYPADSAG
jgi:hypothetical protein